MRTFTIDDSARCLVVEDDDLERIPFFRRHLPNALIVRNPQIAVIALHVMEFSIVLLDFDLPEGSGLDVARHLAAVGFQGRVVIHSANHFGAALMHHVLLAAGICTAVVPFGDFLINDFGPDEYYLGDIDE